MRSDSDIKIKNVRYYFEHVVRNCLKGQLDQNTKVHGSHLEHLYPVKKSC